MGISDRHHFAWLTEALEAFERETGRFAAIRRRSSARRLVRPGGLPVVDWLHGLSDAPVLDLRGDPRYGGGPTPVTTTYADPQMLADFPEEFGAFIRHLDRPPAWTNIYPFVRKFNLYLLTVLEPVGK